MASPGTPSIKVLLVDDDLPNLELYRLAFTMYGHQVVTAESGTQAVEIFGSEHPDAVIVDLILGDMVGTEVIDRMRKMGEATFYLLSEAEPLVLDGAARRTGVKGFRRIGVPVGDVVRAVSAASSATAG